MQRLFELKKNTISIYIRKQPYENGRESLTLIDVEIPSTATIGDLKSAICKAVQSNNDFKPEDKAAYKKPEQIGEIGDMGGLVYYPDNRVVISIPDSHPAQKLVGTIVLKAHPVEALKCDREFSQKHIA